jgi:hypothetical protein
MNLKQTAAITDIEDAATLRWLARTLAPARAAARHEPTEDAVDRMRERIFGETTRKPARQRVAA